MPLQKQNGVHWPSTPPFNCTALDTIGRGDKHKTPGNGNWNANTYVKRLTEDANIPNNPRKGLIP